MTSNVLLQSEQLSKEARTLLSTQRQQQAEAIVDRYQWVGAGVLAVAAVGELDGERAVGDVELAEAFPPAAVVIPRIEPLWLLLQHDSRMVAMMMMMMKIRKTTNLRTSTRILWLLLQRV